MGEEGRQWGGDRRQWRGGAEWGGSGEGRHKRNQGEDRVAMQEDGIGKEEPVGVFKHFIFISPSRYTASKTLLQNCTLSKGLKTVILQ